MTDHAEIQEKVFALYDGELEGKARLETEAHLQACADCRALFEGWKATAKTLFREPEPVASEFFIRRVMDRIDAFNRPRPTVRRHSLRWLIPALGLTALLLAVRQPVGESVSVEMLLLSDVAGSASWVFSNARPSADEILGFAMEDAS